MTAFYYDMMLLAAKAMNEINKTEDFDSDYGCYNNSLTTNTTVVSLTEVIENVSNHTTCSSHL